MIKLKNHPTNFEESDSLSQSESDHSSSQEISEDRVRAIKINEDINKIHTFEHSSSSVIEEESQEDGSSKFRSADKSDLEVSQSEQDVDELERRIRKLESNLQRNLKQLPKDNPTSNKPNNSYQQNKNMTNISAKCYEKDSKKVTKPKLTVKDKLKSEVRVTQIDVRNQSKKLKQNIRINSQKVLTLRKEGRKLSQIRSKIGLDNKIVQIQKELELLKSIDSLQIKLRNSINKKVTTMHQEIQEASLNKTKMPRRN